jgi:hypothetical protein
MQYNWNKMPKDISSEMSSRTAAQIASTKNAEKPKSELEQMMDKYPSFKGRGVANVMNKKGGLSQNYALQWGEDVANPESRISELDRRMALAQEVQPGENWGQAQQGLSALQQRAYGTDVSPWTQNLIKSQQMEEARQRDLLGQQGNIASQQAMSQMAATSGLDPATRARMLKQQTASQMTGAQGISGQGAQARLGLLTQEEQNRLALQQQMPGMQLQADQYKRGLGQFNTQLGMQKAGMWGNQANTEATQNLQNAWQNKQGQLGTQQYNIGTRTGLLGQSNAYPMQKWQTGMQAWGAGKTADAQQALADQQQGGLLGWLEGGGFGGQAASKLGINF